MHACARNIHTGCSVQSSDGREEEIYPDLQTVPVVEIRKVRPE